MVAGGLEGVPGAPVDRKGNIWSGVATEVEHHADNSHVVERA